MGFMLIQSFFFLGLFLCSDSSIAKKLHKKEIRITRKMEYEKYPVFIYPNSISDTQLDTIPIINPNPITGTPIVIPESPLLPVTTAPSPPSPPPPHHHHRQSPPPPQQLRRQHHPPPHRVGRGVWRASLHRKLLYRWRLITRADTEARTVQQSNRGRAVTTPTRFEIMPLTRSTNTTKRIHILLVVSLEGPQRLRTQTQVLGPVITRQLKHRPRLRQLAHQQ